MHLLVVMSIQFINYISLIKNLPEFDVFLGFQNIDIFIVESLFLNILIVKVNNCHLKLYFEGRVYSNCYLKTP